VEFTNSLRKRIDILIKSPKIGKPNNGAENERILILGKYKIYYTISPELKRIEIEYIMHSARAEKV